MEVPDHKVAEIIDGELIVSPRLALPHANVAGLMAVDIVGPFHRELPSPSGPGGWWIFPEPELHFAADVLVPDWAGWRRERMPVARNVPFLTLAPDWACEILSPSTARIDRSRKMAIYAREGVRHLWFVDPLARTVEVYRLEGDRWLVLATHGDDESMRAEPFDAVEIALDRWWLPDVEPTAS